MVRIPRICKICGTIFQAGKSNAVYCSGKCRMKAMRLRDKKERERTYCAWCFKPFKAESGKAMYCCKAHKQAAYRARLAAGGQMQF